MNRHWAAIFLVVGLSYHSAPAQETDTTGGAGSSPNVPSGSGAGTGAASVLIPPVGGAVTPAPSPTPAGATGEGAAAAPSAAPINVPAGYGSLPVTLTPGQGRFAAPPFKFSVSVLQGYDDNVFTAPTNPRPVPTPFPTPTPPPVAQITFPPTIGSPPGFNKQPSITLRGTQPTLQTVPFQPIGNIPRIGSMVTNASFAIAVQAANPRTAFTMDAVIGGLFYWDRPGQTMDYNDSLGMVFYHRLTPRMSISATVNAALLSQANFAVLNAPTTNITGNYLIGGGKLDLTYLFSARFSSVTSYALSTTLYENKTQQFNNLYANTIGEQLRYLLSPRITLVAEVRAESDSYPNSPTADSTSQFLLLGGDAMLSPRLRGTVRFGGQSREFKTAGINSQTSPYFESDLSYVYGNQSTIDWTNWFGLQPSSVSSNEQVSYRTGLGIHHVITSRITGTLSLNYNHISTTTAPSNTDTYETDISCNFGLQYVINRHFTLNATYTFSEALYSYSYSDYYRNQYFFGGSYNF